MRILKQLTRKKNAFFRGIKFNLINYRYRNKPARKAFDPAAVRRVLLLRLDDKVGDMVVTTGCARILAERGYQVSVLTGPICCEILAGSEFIQQVYLYRPRMSLNTLRAVGFDAVIDFDDVTSYERFKLLADLRAASVIGFNKDQYKIYDHSIAFFDSNSHISQRYKQVVKLFGIVDDHPYHYHLPGCRHEREKVARLLSQAGEVELRIAINPFTASEDKDFCRHQVATLHIARAFDKPMVAVYNKRKLKDTGLPGYHIWAPGYDKAKQIVCEEANVADVAIESVWPVIKEQADRLVAARS